MERKDVFKCNLKNSEKFGTLPTKTSVKLSNNGEAIIVSDLLFQKSVFGKWLYY